MSPAGRRASVDGMSEPAVDQQEDRPVDPYDAEWRRPAATPSEQRSDIILAIALGVGTLLSLTLYTIAGFYPEPAPMWASVLWAIGITAPLAFRRRFPCSVAVIVAVMFIVGGTVLVPEVLFTNIALFLAIYTVGAWVPNRRRAALVRVLIIVAMFVWLLVSMFIQATDPDALPSLSRVGVFSPLVAFLLIQILTNILYFGAAYFFGERVYQSSRERAALEQRTVELEAERARSARQAVALERVRIARELHDVVAHHVSLMGVQAGAARRVLDRDPGQASASLEVVEENARTAVEELRRMLGTLRSDDDAAGGGTTGGDGPSTEGITRIAELAESARVAGHPAEYVVVGTERPVPPTVAAVAYRIVQEAVTNILKHAGPTARADVRLRYLDDSVEVEVADDGLGARAARSTSGSGLGHVGMRERVDAVDGRIEIGPRARGGYLVRAWLPTT